LGKPDHHMVALIIYIGFRVTIQNYFCAGPQHGAKLLADTSGYGLISWNINSARRQTGDIIVFQPPIQSSKPFIKRIIGLPGETVEIKNVLSMYTKPTQYG